MITIQSSGAQRLFDHPVYFMLILNSDSSDKDDNPDLDFGNLNEEDEPNLDLDRLCEEEDEPNLNFDRLYTRGLQVKVIVTPQTWVW